MTEDDTFKRLKGLTRIEADVLYNHYYKLGMDSPDTHTIGDVRDFVDKKLRLYGWTCDMLDESE